MDEFKELVTQMISSYILDELHDKELADKIGEFVEHQKIAFVNEKIGNNGNLFDEGGHYSPEQGIVIWQDINKGDIHQMSEVIHEMQHLFSDKISGNKSIVTPQIEEGFADLFSELVINNYRENHKEEYNKIFPNRDYQNESDSVYYSENTFVRMILESIRLKSGEDNQAIKEYIFGDKKKFLEICEENFGQEFTQVLDLQRKGGLADKYNYNATTKLVDMVSKLDVDYSEEIDEDTAGLNARIYRRRNELLDDFKNVKLIKQKLEEKNIKLEDIGLEELPILKEICNDYSIGVTGKTPVTAIVFKPVFKKILDENSVQGLLKVKDLYGYFPAGDDAWDLVKNNKEISKEEKANLLEVTNICIKTSGKEVMNLLNENTIKIPAIQGLVADYLNTKWKNDSMDTKKIVLKKIKECNKFVGEAESFKGEKYKETVQKLIKKYNSSINELKNSREATEDLKKMPSIDSIEEMEMNVKLKGDTPTKLLVIQDFNRDISVVNKENVKNMTLGFLEEWQTRNDNKKEFMSELFSKIKSFNENEKYNKFMLESLQEINLENENSNIFGKENLKSLINLISNDEIKFDKNRIENSKICSELKQKAEVDLKKQLELEDMEERRIQEEKKEQEKLKLQEEQVKIDIVEEPVPEKQEILTHKEIPEIQKISTDEITSLKQKILAEEKSPLKQEKLSEDENLPKSEITVWMNRFKGWNGAIDKVSKNAKIKFVNMKAEISKLIKGLAVIRKKDNQKSTEEKDLNER